MALERELKYSSPDGTVPALAELVTALAALGATATDLGAATHYDVYYDDDARSVQRAGKALRVRSGAGRRVAALKSRGSVMHGVHERDELEEELEFGPEGSGAAARPRWPGSFGHLLPDVDLNALGPRMLIVTERHRFTVLQDGAPVAELAFDEVVCRPAAEVALSYAIDEVMFHEVELEALSAGGRAPVAADRLAQYGAALQAIMPLYPSDITKLERAATLLAAFEE